MGIYFFLHKSFFVLVNQILVFTHNVSNIMAVQVFGSQAGLTRERTVSIVLVVSSRTYFTDSENRTGSTNIQLVVPRLPHDWLV